MAITPPTPVPSVRPIIDVAPRPAPSRSSASPKARASLMSAAGSPSAAADRPRDRLARPRAREVDEEPGRAGCRVVEPRDADADSAHAGPRADRRGADLRRAARRPRPGLAPPVSHLVPVEHLPVVAVALDDDRT